MPDALAQLGAIWRARTEELRVQGRGGDADFLDRLVADVHAALATASAADRAPLMADHFWTQAEAAYFLGVSPRYLRESSCPKTLLPGGGDKPLVRYDPAVVKAWAFARSTGRPEHRAA